MENDALLIRKRKVGQIPKEVTVYLGVVLGAHLFCKSQFSNPTPPLSFILLPVTNNRQKINFMIHCSHIIVLDITVI